MNFVRLLLGTWIAVSLLASVAGAAWPEKPIKLIVPYPPGGLTDAVGRQVGAALAKAKPGTLNFGCAAAASG